MWRWNETITIQKANIMMTKNTSTGGRRAAMATWIFNIGLLCVMIGTALPLLRVEGEAYKWVYCAGAVLALAGKLIRPIPVGIPLAARRLMRLEVWAGLLFCAGGFFMWYTQGAYGSRDWVAFTLAGGALILYTSLMIPRRMAK